MVSVRATTSSAPSWWWPNVSPSVAATTSPPRSRAASMMLRLDRRLEGQGVGEGGVVDDEVDRAVGVVGVAPAVEAAARRLGGVDLARGEDREPDALLGEHAEHEVVDRRLGEPHALGAPAEAVREVEDPPPHVGADVALVAEREDGVAVGLRDRAAGRAIGVHDALVHVVVVRLEPRAAAWARR